MIAKFADFVQKPKHALVFLLLFTQLRGTLSDSVAKKSSIALPNIYEESNNALYVNLTTSVTNAIADNNYEEIIERLNSFLNIIPSDTHVMEEHLRLLVYRQINSDQSLDNLKQFEDLAKKLLAHDKKNEFALSFMNILKITTPNEEVAFDLSVKNLKHPISYFIRAYVTLIQGTRKKQHAFVYSAIKDMEQALKLEVSPFLQDFYSALLKDAKYRYRELITNSSHKPIDFMSLNETYSFAINVKSAEAFNYYQNNRFSIENIKTAISHHYPLIIGNAVEILTSKGYIQAPTNEYKPFVFLSKGDRFHLYQASLNADYQFKLTKVYDHDEVSYYKSELPYEFLTEAVIALINPYGYIIDNLDGYIIDQHDYDLKENSVVENSDILSSLYSYAIPFTGTAVGLFALYKLIKAQQHKKELRVQKEKKQTEISSLLLNELNEKLQPFTSSPIWTLKTEGSSANRFLIARLDSFKEQAETKDLHSTLLENLECTSMSFDKEYLQKLWQTRLIKFFGENNIKIENNISIKINFAIINETYIKPKLNSFSNEVTDCLIKASPEYSKAELLKKIINTKTVLSNLENEFAGFWATHSQKIKTNKDYASSTHSTYANSVIQQKASALLTLCTSLEDYFIEGSVNYYKTTAKELKADLKTQENDLKQSKENSFAEAVEAINQIEPKIKDMLKRFKKIKEDWVQVNDKLKKFELSQTSLQMACKNADKIPAVAPSTPVIKNTVKSGKKEEKKEKKQKETEEKKKARRDKYVEKQKELRALKELELKQQNEEKEKKLLTAEKLKKNVEDLKEKEKKEKEIEKLRRDPWLDMVEHQLEMMNQAISLYNNPANDSLKNFKLKKDFYKDVAYYVLCMGLVKASHSLGMMMNKYEQYNIIEIKPYIVRNNLLHKFWYIPVADFELLSSGATELIKQFQDVISHIRATGFPKNEKLIKMESTLFQDEFLAEMKKSKLKEKSLLKQLRFHMEQLYFMHELIEELCQKNQDLFLKNGVLHQAIVSCMSMVGSLLEDLNVQNQKLYGEFLSLFTQQSSLTIKNAKGTFSIYQTCRRKMGHNHAVGDTYAHKIKFYDKPGKNIYREFPPLTLRLICRETVKLWKEISTILDSSIATLEASEKKTGNLDPNAKSFTPSSSYNMNCNN